MCPKPVAEGVPVGGGRGLEVPSTSPNTPRDALNERFHAHSPRDGQSRGETSVRIAAANMNKNMGVDNPIRHWFCATSLMVNIHYLKLCVLCSLNMSFAETHNQSDFPGR